MNEPTGIEKLVCEDIAKRQQAGIKKYGVTVADNPITELQWQQHLYEELLDAAVYARKLIELIGRKTGAQLIAEERATHEAKGWTAEHDDMHTEGELATKAAEIIADCDDSWGLAKKCGFEGGRVRQLVVAGSLIAAEIDRIQRQEKESHDT